MLEQSKRPRNVAHDEPVLLKEVIIGGVLKTWMQKGETHPGSYRS